MTAAALGVAIVVTGLTLVATITLWLGVCPGRISAYGQLLLPLTASLTFAVAVVAAINGRVIVGLAAGTGAIAAALTFAPKLRGTSPAPPPPGTPTITIVFANLFIENPEPGAAVRQLLDRDPDIVVMTELTDELVRAFDRHGGERYRSRVHRRPLRGDYEAGIFVRDGLEVVRSEVVDDGTLRTVESVVSLDGSELTVIAAHPTAPADRAGFVEWKRQMAALRRRMARDDGATVVLGDLNSGTLQAPFEMLARATRFRDAHATMGTALTPSWGVIPTLPRWVPTVVARLDHLLASPEVEVTALTDLDPVGSDHRPFEAELVLRSPGD